jgi:predicted RNA polymerase sigma factor
MAQYYLLHAARGRFLEQLGRAEEAREAYTTAVKTATLEAGAALSRRPHRS